MRADEYNSLHHVRPHPLLKSVWRFTFLILLTLIGFLFLPWQQTVKGTGVLMAYDPSERLQPVSAPVTGVITQFFASENSHVDKGAKLFIMSDLDPKLSERLEAMIKTLQEQLRNISAESDALKANRLNVLRERNITRRLYVKRLAQATDTLATFTYKIDAKAQAVAAQTASLDRVRYDGGAEI